MARLAFAAAILVLIGCDTSTPTEPDDVNPYEDRDYFEEYEDPDPVDTGDDDGVSVPSAASCVYYPDSHAWTTQAGLVVWDVLVDNRCDAPVLVYIKAAAWSGGRLIARRVWHYEPNNWQRHWRGTNRWHCRERETVSGRDPADDAREHGCGFTVSSGGGLWSDSYSGTIQITYSTGACWFEGPCEEPSNPERP